MEHVIFSQIANHLEGNKILTFAQHGFRPGFSCETQLVTAIHDWALQLENRSQTDVVLLDFSKAFDLVSHRNLAIKMDKYGIRGKTKTWIESFLDNRTQTVVVNGNRSTPTKVTSGVPQGTVLGPLLFLIYINNIGDNITSSLQLFADDSIIYKTIKTSDEVQCAVMFITKKKKISKYYYTLKLVVCARVKQHDYLGIKPR